MPQIQCIHVGEFTTINSDQSWSPSIRYASPPISALNTVLTKKKILKAKDINTVC